MNAKRMLSWKLFLTGTRTNIFILLVLSALVNSSCSLPVFPGAEPELQSYLLHEPVAGNKYFTLQRLPPSFDRQEVLRQASLTGMALRQALDLPLPSVPVPIVIFSALEPDGRYFIQQGGTRHQVAGHYSRRDRMLCVVGQPEDPGFWTVLRHEVAHAVLLDSLPDDVNVPFWMNEGIACFFEQGIEGFSQSGPDSDRLQLVRYLLARGETLQLKNLIEISVPASTTGAAYARSWGIVAFLLQNKENFSCYLQGLGRNSEPLLQLFNACFLAPHESLDSFETECTRWLLSL